MQIKTLTEDDVLEFLREFYGTDIEEDELFDIAIEIYDEIVQRAE